MVQYLACCLEAKLSGEFTAMIGRSKQSYSS